RARAGASAVARNGPAREFVAGRRNRGQHDFVVKKTTLTKCMNLLHKLQLIITGPCGSRLAPGGRGLGPPPGPRNPPGGWVGISVWAGAPGWSGVLRGP